MLLTDLRKDVQFETTTIEFKQRLNEKDTLDWLKTIAGFANRSGGILYIGVKDQSLELNGFKKEEVDHVVQLIYREVNLHISPKPSFRFEYLEYEENNEKRYLIVLKVFEADMKPVYVTYKGFQNVYLREEGQVRLATRDEIRNMYLLTENTPFDLLKTNILYKRENFTKLLKRYQDNVGKELTDKALSAIGFFDENGYLRQGATLFADDYQNDVALIKACVWPGIDRSTDIFLHPETCNLSLIDEVDFAVEYINTHSTSGFLKLSESRKEITSYPKRSVFEAVINAIAHRNYYLTGGFIQVDIFKDRLEISSPGSLLGNMNIDKPIYDISKIRPQSRNPLISKVFELLHMMEFLGTGFDKITADYKNYGKSYQPFVTAIRDTFTITLPDTLYSQGVIEENSIPAIVLPLIDHQTEYDARILSYCYMQDKNTTEIAKYLGVAPSTHLRKDILGNLVKQNYLNVKTKGKASYYSTNKEKVKLA